MSQIRVLIVDDSALVRQMLAQLLGSDPAVARDALELGQSLDLNMLQPVAKPVGLPALREQLAAISAEAPKSRRRAPA